MFRMFQTVSHAATKARGHDPPRSSMLSVEMTEETCRARVAAHWVTPIFMWATRQDGRQGATTRHWLLAPLRSRGRKSSPALGHVGARAGHPVNAMGTSPSTVEVRHDHPDSPQESSAHRLHPDHRARSQRKRGPFVRLEINVERRDLLLVPVKFAAIFAAGCVA